MNYEVTTVDEFEDVDYREDTHMRPVRARYEAGGYDGVIADTRARIEAGSYALPLYNLACCEALAGRREDAIRHLRTAFERRPSLRELAREDTDLDSLREDSAFHELLG